jgi:pentose-5-phosphate-3-epimerase
MTVYAGAQGQSLVNSSLNKVDQLRDIDYRNEIYIDGAVNKQTLPVILTRKNLPDFACVGSYLTKSGDELEDRVKYLKSIESGRV